MQRDHPEARAHLSGLARNGPTLVRRENSLMVDRIQRCYDVAEGVSGSFVPRGSARAGQVLPRHRKGEVYLRPTGAFPLHLDLRILGGELCLEVRSDGGQPGRCHGGRESGKTNPWP